MEKLSITLPPTAWNLVLNILAQRPFAEVADLIVEIKRQADAQSPGPQTAVEQD